MLSVHNVSKSYYEQVIFENVGFSVNPGERIGVVGRNGHGKTTLFKLLTGQEECDQGTVAVPRNYRIGYLEQHLHFTQSTILAEGGQGLPLDQADQDWKVKRILMGLGFGEADFGRPPSEFSGGFQIRLNLAKVLVSEPNLLLLDEPTNFLDIVSIRWLVRFLNEWPNEVMLISHNRGFMDSIVTHILGVHRCKVKKIPGKTQQYYSQITLEEDTYEKSRQNLERKAKHLEQFITRFRAKARHASLAQSRQKTLDKLEVPDMLKEIPNLSFTFNAIPFKAKHLGDTRDLSFSYTGQTPYLIEGFNMSIVRGDRICIIGKNGKGKTTFIRLLARELQPVSGQVSYHPKVTYAYYEQGATARLRNNLTVEEEIIDSHPTGDCLAARGICGAMMFPGDLALKRIRVLSGGEKCRVLLGKLLIMPSNLLLLDEPTHHLDMPSCEAMIEAVAGFDGAAIVVTHDEHFLHRVATKLVVFHRNRLFTFPGTYAEFLDRVGWDEGVEMTQSELSQPPRTGQPRGTSKREQRQARAETVAKRSRVLNPYKEKIRSQEKAIEEQEARLEQDNASLVAATGKQDWATVSRLSKAIPEQKAEIEKQYEKLAEITEKFEQEKQELDQE
jgi:ATP-binding cassette subfamily F protein 3